MMDWIVTPTTFTEDGESKTFTNSILPFYVEDVDGDFFHVEIDNSVQGRLASEITLNGFLQTDSATLLTALRAITGWQVPVQEEMIDFVRRQTNAQRMNNYMANLVTLGQLTQNNFDLFLSDTAALVQQYLGGGGRLITWIETVSRNGFNATTTGFKTKTAYRGALINGLYPRAEDILVILNDL